MKVTKENRHKIIKEAFRHLEEFSEIVRSSVPDPSVGKDGNGRALNAQYGGLKDVIDYGGITLSYFDLLDAFERADLPPRKKEAFTLNVIQDMRQRDVAEIMNISTVSVGQYSEQAAMKIAKEYFKDDDNQEE